MPGVQWLALLLQHVPDKGEHLVRYYGWYSNRSRGMRRQGNENNPTEVMLDEAPADSEFSRTARAAWARLIQKGLRSRSHVVSPLRGSHAHYVQEVLYAGKASPPLGSLPTQSGPACRARVRLDTD